MKVNGTQDLSLVKSEKELVFSKEFNAVGDKVTIDYDVTNASKNYDATISISCTESNDYLNVTNNFDQKSNLLARSTRTGTLTVELANAVSQETSYEIKCTITGTAVERETQGSGEVSNPLEPYPYMIGNEITIADEKFNIISDNGDTVTMLAQYNLGTDYKQSETENSVRFSNSMGWEYKPGPKEIDIQQFGGDARTYVNEYVSYLKGEIGDSTLTGTLITLTELKSLGCSIQEDYSYTVVNENCKNSEHSSWLDNGQNWWTRSANPNGYSRVWVVYRGGVLNYINYANTNGVRPVITISKKFLTKTIIEFSIDSTMYKAYEGMTWEEWVNSPFNTGGYEIIDNMLSINYGDEDYDHIEVVYNYDSFENAMGTDIIVQNASYVESSHQPD